MACIGVPALRARELARLDLPDSKTLMQRIRSTAGSERPQELLWELDELVIEADAGTRAPVELSLGLSRAALASGTGLAVLTMASNPDLLHLPGAGMAFGAGVVGAMGAAYFGRLAKGHALRARIHWSKVAKDVRCMLEEASGH